ncbi:MAG: serine/threonine-protein kinase [Chromatiaceae bacterium]
MSETWKGSRADIPKALGKYEIRGVLGRGGMGVVYRAYDRDIDRPVAIKVVHAHLVAGGTNEDLLQRFRQEARAAARCVHPNIVTVFDYGVSQLGPFMVMELVEGLDLKALLRAERAWPLRQRADIVLQVLAALEYAHKQGVVHRDIKPANILLLDNGSVKVTDFGVAKIDTSDLTFLGEMIGTPTYMSPEARNGEVVDCRADLYTVGVVLLELLSGQRPDPEHLAPTDIAASLDEAGLPDTERRGFERLIRKALEPSPARRHQTAAQLVAELKSVLAPDTVYLPATQELAATVIETRRHVTARLGGREEAEHTSNGDISHFTPSPEITALLNESLARHLGPVSSRVVRAAVARSSGLNDLIERLAAQIPSAGERAEFIRSVDSKGVRRLGTLTGTPGGGTHGRGSVSPEIGAAGPSRATPGSSTALATQFSQTELAQITEQLVVHVGPLAPHLVKRAAKRATNARQLYELLAEQITDERERETFLSHCRW